MGDQPPEFWNQYKTGFAPGTHGRNHPLLDWTELNFWEYIERGNITNMVESGATNVAEIIVKLKTGKFAHIAERAGGAQDKDDGGGLETLRDDGYM